MKSILINEWFGWTAVAIVWSGVLTAWADPVSGQTMTAALLAVAAVWLGVAGISGTTPRVHLLLLPITGAAVWAGIQVLCSCTVYRFNTVLSGIAWLAYAAVFAIGYSAFDGRGRERVATAFTAIALIIAVLGSIAWFTSPGRVFWFVATDYKDLVMGPFLNRDQYAAFIEMILPIPAARALSRPRSWPAYAVITAALFGSVVLTGSRAGSAVIACELLVLAAIAVGRMHSKAAIRIGAMAAATGVSLAVFGGGLLWTRLHGPDPFAIRRELLVSTRHMIRARPLEGFGLGNWPAVYPAYAVIDPPGIFMNHAHNDWAEWVAEGGLPFGLLVAAIFTGAVFVARRCPYALGVCFVMLHALVDFPMQKPAVAAAVFLLLGVFAGGEVRKQELEKSRIQEFEKSRSQEVKK